MLNEIFSDLWKNYRGRLLGSIFGLFIGVMFLILGFVLLPGSSSAISWTKKKT